MWRREELWGRLYDKQMTLCPGCTLSLFPVLSHHHTAPFFSPSLKAWASGCTQTLGIWMRHLLLQRVETNTQWHKVFSVKIFTLKKQLRLWAVTIVSLITPLLRTHPAQELSWMLLQEERCKEFSASGHAVQYGRRQPHVVI